MREKCAQKNKALQRVKRSFISKTKIEPRVTHTIVTPRRPEDANLKFIILTLYRKNVKLSDFGNFPSKFSFKSAVTLRLNYLH